MAIEIPDEKDQIDFPSIMEDYQREQEEAQRANIVNTQLRNIGIGTASAYAGKEAIRAAAQPLLQRVGSKASIEIDKYYDPRLSKWQKITMSADHFINNESDEIAKMVNDYGTELGINKNTNIKQKLVSVAKKDFDMDISHIIKGGNPVNNMGQFRAAMDEDMAIRRLNLSPGETPSLRGKLGKAQRVLRAENAWKNLNDILYDGKITEARQRLFDAGGLHRIEKTNMGKLFSFDNKNPFLNHGNAIGAWGSDIASPEAKITATKIKNSSDIRAIQRAVGKDHMQQMAEHVMYRAKNLNDSNEIQKLATERFKHLQELPSKNYASLHKQVGVIDEEVARFMKAFKYNPATGIGTLQFSPMRKPLPLIGGFNANINYQRYTGKDIIPSMKKKYPGTFMKGVGQNAKIKPVKLRKSYLYTDALDLAKGARWVQKNPHITYYTNTEILPYKSYKKSLLSAIKAKEWDKAYASAIRLAKRYGGRIIRAAVLKR